MASEASIPGDGPARRLFMTEHKPIETIRLTPRDKKRLVEEMNQPGKTSKGHEAERRSPRIDFNVGEVVVIVKHPNGSAVTYSVVPRNLSGKGIGFLHGQFLHPGSECRVMLPMTGPGHVETPGRVVRCRHVKGLMHEVSVLFDEPIELDSFIRQTPPPPKPKVQELSALEIGYVRLSVPRPEGGRNRIVVRPRKINTAGVVVCHHRSLAPGMTCETTFQTAGGAKTIHAKVGGSIGPHNGLFEVVFGFLAPLDPAMFEAGDSTAPAEKLAGRALIVDANDADRKLLRVWVSKHGLEVNEARNAEQARVDIAAGTSQVVFLSVAGAEESDFSAVAAIRSAGFSGCLVVVCPTDHEAAQAAAIEAGANALLGRPTDPASLRQVLTHLIGGDDGQGIAASGGPITSSMSSDAEMRPLIEAFVGQLGDYAAKLKQIHGGSELDAVARVCFQLKNAGQSHGFDAISKVARLAVDAIQQPPRDLEHIRRSVDDLIAVIKRAKA